MEQMDFSIEVSESEIEKFADYLYQKENAKATINKYMADIKKFLFFLADDKRINKKVLLQYKEWLVQCRLPSKTAICAMFGGQCVT